MWSPRQEAAKSRESDGIGSAIHQWYKRLFWAVVPFTSAYLQRPNTTMLQQSKTHTLHAVADEMGFDQVAATGQVGQEEYGV